MRFEIASRISYEVGGPSTLILSVHAMKVGPQTIHKESFVVEPRVRCEEFVLEDGQNRFVRLETGAARTLNVTYRAIVETQIQFIPRDRMKSHSIGSLHRNVIPFLYPSRYCQSDKLGRLALQKFGDIPTPFDKVAAISNWIHDNVEYLSGSTNSQTSAYDTVTERAGVCRDFSHLGIALCRALSIPARYFTGYAHQLVPPDFHACFEAYIGGRWLFFDPTRLVPLNGLVRIASGRDAAEASVATIFGPAKATAVEVSCMPAEPGFKPVTADQLSKRGVCLDAA